MLERACGFESHRPHQSTEADGSATGPQPHDHVLPRTCEQTNDDAAQKGHAPRGRFAVQASFGMFVQPLRSSPRRRSHRAARIDPPGSTVNSTTPALNAAYAAAYGISRNVSTVV